MTPQSPPNHRLPGMVRDALAGSQIATAAIFLAVWALTFTLAVWILSGPPAGAQACTGADCPGAVANLAFNMEDMDFILRQIKISERHAAGEDLLDILPNASVPWGLRTVTGEFNNLIPGQTGFGQADLEFPSDTPRTFSEAQVLTFPLSPNDVVGAVTSYQSGDGKTVQDSTPRLISHLITNQSVANPAAVYAAAQVDGSENVGPDITGIDQLRIPNVQFDAGLSAPINAFTTFFGQFFDHGLDLINKGGNGLVFIPLQEDDPLYDPTSPTNFMLMTRASRDAGPDGLIGTDDDVSNPINATTPHVDQQQTYASHASAQILLRHYEVRDGRLQNSGHLLDGAGIDGTLDTADDGGMATWDTAQDQALKKFGIILDDFDGNNVPMIAADPYGNFIPGSARGLPQLVTESGLIEGNTAAGSEVDASQAIRVNHSFFLDVAHTANPNGQAGPLLPDPDSVINARSDVLSGQAVRGIRAAGPPGTFDDELLGVHFLCGDGRCNENIALTTIHTIFHREHNRLVDVAKRVVLDSGDLAALNEWLDTPLTELPAWGGLPFPVSSATLANQESARDAVEALDLDWNGQRLFQVARFGTEMQYNRIVFDEFAPTLAGLKDVFVATADNSIDPTISTEFSQTVYRFGHSMLTQTVDRLDADFAPIPEAVTGDPAQLGLFEAFLNPLALYNSDANGVPQLDPEAATGAVIRGINRTVSNEIDEFVAGALQNNLVGLPLDLGAINIARGRDVGNPTLNDARRMFYAQTLDSRLTPYMNWVDYLDNMKYEPSLVNFLAAYGTHPTLAGPDGRVGNADDPVTTFVDRRAAACAIVGSLTPDPAGYCADVGFGPIPATPADSLDFLFSSGAWENNADGTVNTGLDDIDFWNGGLAEEVMAFGGFLGSTHNHVFETQIERLQNGDRFYYVGRTATIHFLSELESNSFSNLVMRNTDIGEEGGGSLSANIFLTQDAILEVDQTQQFDADGLGGGADPLGESALVPLVVRDADRSMTNVHIADETRFVQLTGALHATIGGTSGDDTILGGTDDDTIWGRAGNDRIDGGDGPDLISGGAGDDIITDLGGFDVIEGGEGNDAISSGNDEDVVFGDAGNDFIVNPSELGEIFGGEGDDYIFDGFHVGHVRGGAGADWMENLGGGEDLFQGDDGAAPEAGEPAVKGDDVFIGHGGNNDADMENGDDIVVDGPGIERAEGQLGFDWMSFQNDRFGVNVDLDLTIFLRPQLPPSNDTVLNRYDRLEGISGSAHSDILRGTPNQLGGERGNELVNFDLIDGLDALVPQSERRDLEPDPITLEAQFGWTGGEIMLGGGGSDLLAGGGGDDIIDGDLALQVGISTPDPAIRSGPLGQALRAAKQAAKTSASQAAADQAAADAAEAAHLAALAAAEAAANAAVAAGTAATADGGTVVIDGSLTADGVVTGSIETVSLAEGCETALVEGTTTATADAAAAATAATAEVAAADHAVLQATADASAVVAAAAAADLVIAQTAMNTADVIVIVAGMQDLMVPIFEGFINPGELAISRVISDHDGANAGTDIALFQGNLSDYSIIMDGPDDYIQVTDLRLLPLNVRPDRLGNEGRDLLRNIERLQFADQSLVLGGGNSPAVGQPTISGTPVSFQTVTASAAAVTDLDNVTPGNPTGAITSPIDWTWQVELRVGTGFFQPIIRPLGLNANGDAFEVHGESLQLTADEEGLLVRLSGMFQDDDLVFEVVTSAPVLVGVGTAPGTCGNGAIDAGEQCDDGNVIDGDGCSSICTNEGPPPACGDGTLDAGEECDDGNLIDGDGCSAVCTIELGPACGNGTLEAGEECDDGNLVDGDGCSSVCENEASVTITRARYIAAQDRLRVRGFSEPIGSSANLFVPGTLNGAGTGCDGTLFAVLATGIDGGFTFNSGQGVVPVNPGSVCVSSDSGAAAALPTTN